MQEFGLRLVGRDCVDALGRGRRDVPRGVVGKDSAEACCPRYAQNIVWMRNVSVSKATPLLTLWFRPTLQFEKNII